MPERNHRAHRLMIKTSMRLLETKVTVKKKVPGFLTVKVQSTEAVQLKPMKTRPGSNSMTKLKKWV